MGKKDELFREFDPVSTKQWEEKIRQDLRGISFEKLTWKTPEGFDLKPFYREEDLEGLDYLKSIPGKPSGFSTGNDWEIRQEIEVANWEEANTVALDALNKGAAALTFNIPDTLEADSEGIRILLNGIYPDCIGIHFNTALQAGNIFDLLLEIVKEKETDPSKIKGSFNAGPLSYLTTHGYYPGGTEKAFDVHAKLIRKAARIMPGMRTTGIDGRCFAEAGSSLVQEAAFSLVMISEYLDKLSGRGLSPGEISRSFHLNFSTGPAYFMEISLLRAVRVLYAHLLKAWKPGDEESMKCYIHCSTARWNQTVYDPWVNMLRGTTGSMAAVIGGADALTVTPFDQTFRESTPFACRVARNSQIILKEEASLHKVSDPSSGSYYIENLTDSLAENAWDLFLETEDSGGYLSALSSGFIQGKIKASADRKDAAFASRKQILVGTNEYPDIAEACPELPLPGTASRKTGKADDRLIEPLRKYRVAEPFEILRMQTDRLAEKPVVFLLTYGNPAWRKARATFAANFFGCGGYRIIDNPGFENPDDGLSEALAQKASIIVLCSSDEEYPALAPIALEKTKGKALLVIAGYPKDSLEELKNKGITNFIHIRSDLPAEIERYHRLLGIVQ